MSTDRSDRAHEGWRQSAERFDYFLAGLAAALAGYLGKSLVVPALGPNAATFDLAAFIFFGSSMVCGLKRLECFTNIMKFSSKRLYHLEMAAEAASAPQSAISQDLISGNLYSPSDLQQRAMEHRNLAAGTNAAEAKLIQSALNWYKRRDQFLIAGFVALAIGRLLPAVFSRG